MPVSEQPLVERIARVLAGAAHSSNAEGSDPSAGGQGRPGLARASSTRRSRCSTPCASPTRRWPRPATPDTWHRMVEAAIEEAERDRVNARARERSRTRVTRAGRWSACVLASSLSFVDGSVLNVALPAIRASYGAGAAEVQWVVNAYLLPLSALLLLGGALGDHYGRRRLLVIGTSLFARRVAGLRACAEPRPAARRARRCRASARRLLLPNSLALLNAAFEGEKRGRAVGIWAAAGAAAAAVAPLIGGWLVGNVGWPAIFYINLPLALGAILLALRFVAESREPGGGRTDYAGALLATAGLGGADLWADPVVARTAASPIGR